MNMVSERSLFDIMDEIMDEVLQDAFDKSFPDVAKQIKRCRTCAHRQRFALNEHSNKIVQCCELQPSKRSNSGYKTIKVTDVACTAYKERE